MQFKCIIGEVSSKPPVLTYLSSLSSRKHKVWIGFCGGDKSHEPHLVRINRAPKYVITHNKTNIFKKPSGKDYSARMYESGHTPLRCPIGKCWMILQRRITKELGMKNVDVFHCKGHRQKKGHKEHEVRIEYGYLETPVLEKRLGTLIVTIEND